METLQFNDNTMQVGLLQSIIEIALYTISSILFGSHSIVDKYVHKLLFIINSQAIGSMCDIEVFEYFHFEC